jgi:hypothetical protein
MLQNFASDRSELKLRKKKHFKAINNYIFLRLAAARVERSSKIHKLQIQQAEKLSFQLCLF